MPHSCNAATSVVPSTTNLKDIHSQAMRHETSDGQNKEVQLLHLLGKAKANFTSKGESLRQDKGKKKVILLPCRGVWARERQLCI